MIRPETERDRRAKPGKTGGHLRMEKQKKCLIRKRKRPQRKHPAQEGSNWSGNIIILMQRETRRHWSCRGWRSEVLHLMIKAGSTDFRTAEKFIGSIPETEAKRNFSRRTGRWILPASRIDTWSASQREAALSYMISNRISCWIMTRFCRSSSSRIWASPSAAPMWDTALS